MNLTVQKYLLAFFLLLLIIKSISASDSIVWMVDNLDTIGDLPVTVVGNPKVIDTGNGLAVEFDGIKDGLFINTNPLAGADAFTAEIVFKPYSGGAFEQRFLHIQQDDNNRILIELRSTIDKWYIDTFIKSGSSSLALIKATNLHPDAEWHTASLVYENKNMRHYIDGKLEMSGNVTYAIQTKGITSLGVRQNKVAWYKGAIKMVRVTHRALSPEEFLKGDGTATNISDLNKPLVDRFKIESFLTKNNDSIGILDINIEKRGNLSVNVFSLNGQKFSMIENQSVEAGMHEIPLNFSKLTPGIYMVNVSVDGYTQTQKVELKR